ncbi:MAG: serine/threonine protein kinase [Gemmatimonadetes bacterium]|nr:serine/threonine protein kinase [Gemmatimonadota bacterium]
MTPERWGAIQSLFFAAANIDDDARDAFLADACPNDEALRHEVAALLRAEQRSHDSASTFISDLIAAVADDLVDDSGVSRVGERAGPYRLLRELGHGGMGSVYLAERADAEYHSVVAIKFVRGALAAPDLERRFRAERQILADLTHPGIAWLLDAGTLPDGTPFLVMEYIDGEPIDAWCDRRELGLRGRIALFCEVCAAVQYAHQALVIHRDLKPSNILVTADGTPKLVDFGIAKLIAGPDLEATATLRMLTPTYAAPEQVRGGRIAVATDVYALGGVLYRLITGRPANDVTGGSPTDIERRICELDAPRPSAATVGLAMGWRRRLQGDLDTITQKALHKDPERRYATVDQFVEDLRRHTDGLPVRARADTLRYRTGKFVRRHRRAVAATVGVVLGVGALTGFYMTDLAHERDRAQLEAAKASEISEFLSALFQQSDPRIARGQDVTARELLDRGAARVDRELTGQPAVQATLLGVMSRVYHGLGVYGSAVTAAERSLRIRRDLYGNVHPDVAASTYDLALALFNRGDYERSESHYREALRIRRALYGGDHPDVVHSLAGLAFVLVRTEQLDEAEAAYREALATARRLGDDDRRIASLSDGLASTLLGKGDFAGSVPLFEEAVALVRKRSPVDSLTLATALNNLAGGLVELGRGIEAEPMYREALAVYTGFYGEAHPYVSAARMGLSRLLHDLGALEESKAFAMEALAFDTVSLGPRHPDIAPLFGRIGTILIEQERFAEAEQHLRRALDIRRDALGPEHPYTAISMNELAALHRASNDLARAESAYHEVLALRRRIHPPSHPYLAFTLVGLGTVLLDLDRAGEAEPLLREALAIREAALPSGHWQRGEAESALGGTLARLGHHEEGERLLVSGFETLHRTRGASHRMTRRALERVTTFLEMAGRPADAARFRAN